MSERRAFITKKDIWLLGGVLALAAIIYIVYMLVGTSFDKVTARITLDGVMLREFALDKNETFSLPENPGVRFEIKDGAVAFTESDCPDKVCIHEGYISAPGQIAACLPNKLLLQIIGSDAPGDDEWEPDAFAQ